MKAKCLINRCFNVGHHIVTIRETNMNFSILQCKNCWKCEHTTYMYYIHGSRCQKYNRPYKLKHYRNIVWCCKANFKTNPSRLETLKGEPYTHFFKYINYKDDH